VLKPLPKFTVWKRGKQEDKDWRSHEDSNPEPSGQTKAVYGKRRVVLAAAVSAGPYLYPLYSYL